MNCKLRGFLLLLPFVGQLCSSAEPAPAPKPYPERLQWWAEARFGMFVHWGPVSLTGQEIGWARGDQVPIDEYDRLYLRFNPTNFDAAAWVSTAKAAGMRYLVLTTKHHDGFCLWNTHETDHNIMRSPFGRDVVKELSQACRKAGLRFCTYYSTCDWHHPDFPLTSPGGKVKRQVYNLDRYEQYLRAQVKELITQYGPLGLVWFDVPQYFDPSRGQGVIDFVRSLQPDIIVNDRTGAPGDYDTPEQQIGAYQDQRPWETCMTLCQQWAWKPDDRMKSLDDCIRNLVRCAAGDGNFLFNVGPMPDGRIEERQVARLRELGQWLQQNGDAIYGTRGGPWKPTSRLASTRKGNVIFIHLLQDPGQRVELRKLPKKVKSATLMDGTQIPWAEEGESLVLGLNKQPGNAADTIIRLTLDGSAMEIAALSTPRTDIKSAASNVFQNQQDHFGPQAAFDDDLQTRWATDYGTRRAWIASTFPAPRRIKGVRISEAIAERVRAFEIQCRLEQSWRTLCSGGTLGSSFIQEFPPVTATEFRLNILEATEGPTISEIDWLSD